VRVRYSTGKMPVGPTARMAVLPLRGRESVTFSVVRKSRQ
jgi:hypothetical protein